MQESEQAVVTRGVNRTYTKPSADAAQHRKWLIFCIAADAYKSHLPGRTDEDGVWQVAPEALGQASDFTTRLATILDLDFSSEWRYVHAHKSQQERLEQLKGMM